MTESKTSSERKHAKLRAWQRLHLDLNKYLRRELIARIQAGRCRLVRRQSLRISVFRDVINGVATDIVYDRRRKAIVTFLFAEVGGENDHKA